MDHKETWRSIISDANVLRKALVWSYLGILHSPKLPQLRRTKIEELTLFNFTCKGAGQHKILIRPMHKHVVLLRNLLL